MFGWRSWAQARLSRRNRSRAAWSAADVGPHDLERHLVAEQPPPGAEHRPHARLRRAARRSRSDHPRWSRRAASLTMIRHGCVRHPWLKIRPWPRVLAIDIGTSSIRATLYAPEPAARAAGDAGPLPLADRQRRQRRGGAGGDRAGRGAGDRRRARRRHDAASTPWRSARSGTASSASTPRDGPSRR